MLYSFRGRCNFHVYIPNKSAKHGLKVFGLIDSLTFYIFNMNIYTGKQPGGTVASSNKTDDLVIRIW